MRLVSPISWCSGTPLHARGEIPQRDIEPRYRKHRDAVAAEQMQIALDLFHEGGDSGCIRNRVAAGLRRDHFVDGGEGCPRADIAEGIAPAGDAGIGRNLDHDDLQRRNCRSALPEARHPGIIGDADMMGPDVGDQHGFPDARRRNSDHSITRFHRMLANFRSAEQASVPGCESKDCQMKRADKRS